MSFDLNHPQLIQFLNQNTFEPTYQKETDQTYILMKIKEVEVPVFFGIPKDSSLLQILGYLPYEIKQEALPEVARLLHLLNKDLDMPGFGMDENAKLLFYRCVIPCMENKVNPELLLMYINALKLACDGFMHAIELIATGKVSVKDIVKNG